MDIVTYGLLSKRITSSLTGIGSVTPVPPNKLKFTNKKDGTDFTITLPMNMTQAQLDWLVKMFDKVVINDTTNDLEYNGIPLNNIVFGTVADFDDNMQKLYCNISENKLYRYNGSSYVAVGGESGASNFDYLIVEKYSKLGNSYTTSKIAYVQTDETISSVKYKKGFYEFDVTTNTWNYLGEQNNVHSNREVIDKFDESDVLDTDGITVLYKQPTFDSKELLFKTDIGDVNVYAYKTGTIYKKDDIVLNGAILYVALRDTQDTTQIAEDDFVAISSNGSTIEDYVSGTDYKVGDIVIYDNRLYKCKVEPQADNTTFDETEWIKLSISNDLEKFLADFTVVELKEDISDPDLVTGYDLKFKNKELAYREEIKGDTDIYFYQTGVVFAKDSVVLKDNVFYIALRDTVDLVNFDDVTDFAMIHKLPDTVEIYKYVSGTDYEIGQYVIKGNDIYECIALQADNTVFDDVNEFKLISNYVLDSTPLTMDDLVDSSVVIAVPYTGDTDKTVTSDYVYKTLSDIIPKLHAKTQDELYHEIYEYTTAYYELSSVGTDGALEIVADGTSPLTDTQIEESNVTPIKEGQTVAVGDYVILVESQKTNVTKFVPRSELDTVPTKDSENRLTSGSVYSSLYETKQRTVIDTPENYVVCTSTDIGALEVVADDTTPTATQVTLSTVQAFVPTAQVGEYYQHIDEVSHLEDYEDTIYREKDDSYSISEIEDKVTELKALIVEISTKGLKPVSMDEYQSFMNDLVVTADDYVAP